MPLDVHCPKCNHAFPVTEARSAVGVECPGCAAELTAEFRKRPTPVPGQHPYELFVSPGRPAGAGAPAAGKKPLPLDDDGETVARGGGGMGVVVFAGVSALVLALLGLVGTGYLLFTNLDTSDSTVGNLNSGSGSGSGSKGGTRGGTPVNPRPRPDPVRPGPRPEPIRPGPQPAPFRPQQPRDEFDLRVVPGRRQEITPPPIDLTSPVTLKLPGPAESVTVGGNGRYVVFHVPSTQQITVFDASRGALVATERVPDAGLLFLAGGQNRVVTCSQGGRVLRSYSLPDLKKQFDFTSPLFHHPDGIAMGSAVNSPLLITDPFGSVALFDLTDTGATVVEGSKTEHPLGGLPASPPNPRAVPNGNVFFFSRANNRGEETGILTVEGRKWKVNRVQLTTVSPSADSRYLMGFGWILDVRARKPVIDWMGNDGSANWFVGGTSGRAFLRLAQTQQNGKGAVVVSAHLTPQLVDRDKRAVMLGVLPEMDGLIDWFQGVALPLDRHLFFVPDAKLLAVLTASKDRLVLRRVDAR